MSGARQGSRLQLEQLEDRYLLATASAAYGQLALSFEPNRGQAPAQVDYVARGSGYSISLTPTQALLALAQTQASGSSTSSSSDVLMMQLVGANASASGMALDKLPGVSNYVVGNNPSQWVLNIPTYAAVQFQNVYPGINVVYHGSQNLLEYDFVVSRGANPGTIRLAVSGAASMSLDGAGNLVLHTAGGDLVEQAPVVYQEVNGVRQTVAGRYVIENNGQLGFAIGSYNASLPLTIDPVLSYSTYLGGSDADQGNAIAVDSAGEAYITGFTTSTDFPTANAVQPHNHNAFVVKLNAAGNALLFSTYLGGSGLDEGLGIAVNAAGNAFVTGATSSSDFPTAGHPFQASLKSQNGSDDVFVTEFNPSGGLVYSTYLGGSGDDASTGVALDSASNAYITGHTDSSDFPTLNAIQGKTAGEYAFVSKLNSTGSALLYSTYLGGAQPAPFLTQPEQQANAIAVDGAGDAYVTGYAFSSDFPTAGTPFQSSASGAFPKVFVSKLNAAGTRLVYSTFIGGHSGTTSFSGDSGIISGEGGTGIAVDATGDAYVTGFTFSSDFPTAGSPFEPAPDQANLGSGFVLKLNPAGSGLIYSSFLNAKPAGIAVDATGNAFVAGTAGPGFELVGSLSTTFPPTDQAGFVSEVNATGSALVYSTLLEGTDNGAGLAVDPSDNVYVTGTTSQSTMPTVKPLQPTFHGQKDAFVAKLSPQTVSSVSPARVFEGGGSFMLTVHGSGFTSGSTVNWNGTPLTTTFVSSTELQATVPASFIAEENDFSVTVSIPNVGTTNPETVYVTDATGTQPRATLSTVLVNQAHVTFAVDRTNTLYRHDLATGWSKIASSILSVSAVTDPTTGLAVVFAVTLDHGLLVDDSNGLRQIGAAGTIASVSAGTDLQGRAEVYVVTTDGSLIEWQETGGWRPAIGGAGTIAMASALAGDRAVAVTTGHAVYEYDPHIGWYPLAGNGFALSLSAVTDIGGRDAVFVQSADEGLWRYDFQGWQHIGGAGSIASVSAALDASGLALVTVLTTDNQISQYSDPGWSPLAPAPGVPVQVDSVPEVTPGIGVPVLMSEEQGLVFVTADGALYQSVITKQIGTPPDFFPLTSAGFMDV